MKRSKIIFGIAMLVVLVAIGAGIYYFVNRKPDITYREVPVGKGNVAVTILTTGTVQPENKVEIKPPVAGRVEQVLVKEGAVVKKGQILAWMSSSERAALLDAARAEGEEEVKRWEEDYKATPVIAPIDGTIIFRNVESGQSFANSDSVFTMSDRLTVKAQVDETDIGVIKVGQEAMITLDAYADQQIPAKVDQIAFDAKMNSNITTYLVDVLPKELPPFMRSGMTANVVFQIEAKHDVLVIPSQAILPSEAGDRVRVKGPVADEPIERPITIGITDGKISEVLEGLSMGDIVLIQEAKKTDKQKGTNPFNPFGGRRR